MATEAHTRPATVRLVTGATSRTARLLNRPELGAVAGTIAVFAFFAIVAGGSGF